MSPFIHNFHSLKKLFFLASFCAKIFKRSRSFESFAKYIHHFWQVELVHSAPNSPAVILISYPIAFTLYDISAKLSATVKRFYDFISFPWPLFQYPFVYLIPCRSGEGEERKREGETRIYIYLPCGITRGNCARVDNVLKDYVAL